MMLFQYAAALVGFCLIGAGLYFCKKRSLGLACLREAEGGAFRGEAALIAALVLLGVAVRAWGFGRVPGGVNQDEAYAGYEAWSLLHSGVDSWGYGFPVYLTAWGSGMNVLNSYLMMPFIALGGLNVWTIRLPQLILACVSLPVFYLLVKLLYNRRMALVGLAFLAICPWHICLSRWGLESNLAPGFLLLGMYFFALGGLKDNRFFCLSALFYGLSLYCYATIWPLVPVVLVLHAGYFAWVGKLRLNRWVVISVVLLGILALPLVLFLLINWGILPEVRTAFFSIPKMVEMRSSVSFEAIRGRFLYLVHMLAAQTDETVHNSVKDYGLYYYLSMPFAVLGLGVCITDAFTSLKHRRFGGGAFVLLLFLPVAALACCMDININRINSIHYPMIFFCVIGLYTAAAWLPKKKAAAAGMVLAFCVCFAGFVRFYFTDFNVQVSEAFREGCVEAVQFADAQDDTTPIYISDVSFSLVLYATQMPPEEFAQTVQWENYPAAFLAPVSYGRFLCGGDAEPSFAAGDIVVMPAEKMPEYPDRQITQFGGYAVSVRK